MPQRTPSAVRTATALSFALSLPLLLAGCGDLPHNTSLYSVKQPVVDRSTFTLDVAAGPGGLTIPERRRLADWFETLDLRYGDRIAVDSAIPGDGARDDVAALAGRHGLLLAEGAPITEGHVPPGAVRVVVTRSRAHVPGCPDFSEQFNYSLDNATDDNFGCAINSNLAAMVADPEHLLHGARGNGETTILSSSKAIQTYREMPNTGRAGLDDISSRSAGEGN